MGSVRRPAFDPELRAGLAIVGGMIPPTITPDLVGRMRDAYASAPIDETLHGRDVSAEHETIPGPDGAPIEVTVLRPTRASGPRPCVLFAHSGGMMFGDRFSGIDLVLGWVERLGCVMVTVEYRLAPEHQDPVPHGDVYAALEWIAGHARRLGIRRDRLLLCGASGGAGLVAGVALAARDREGPRVCGQVLDYPMIDDRGGGCSMGQFDGVGVWDRVSNQTGWRALLGDRCGGPAVSPYAAPSRAEDLAGLPPTFVGVGAADVFRDDAIDFARRIWDVGGEAELHVWQGGFHGFDVFAPHTALGRIAIRTRDDWVARMIAD